MREPCARPSSADRAAISQPTARVAAGAVFLRQFQTEVAFFHNARRWRRVRALRATKMGSGLPWPSGSSLRSQPASTAVIWSRAIQRGSSARARVRARRDVRRRIGKATLEFGNDAAGSAKPTAKACPPKRVKRSAQVSMALSNWNPSTDRPEPCAMPSSTLMTSAGLAVRSTTREARMPMTPRCQPSPSTTTRRAAANSSSVASRASIAARAVLPCRGGRD